MTALLNRRVVLQPAREASIAGGGYALVVQLHFCVMSVPAS
jgi:hypothetical protein